MGMMEWWNTGMVEYWNSGMDFPSIHHYPARACAARGKVISRDVLVSVLVVSINLHFFWNQSFISQNTHFQRSI